MIIELRKEDELLRDIVRKWADKECPKSVPGNNGAVDT